MTQARMHLVCVEETPYYHCIGRCVRRAFLCGLDESTYTSYEHRRVWMSERLSVLSDVFAVDICAYAVMSNHYHLVVRIASERAASWSNREVVERWTQLFEGIPVAHRFLNGEALDATEAYLLATHIQKWQARLGSLSWFMRCLNEHIARLANAEDGCTGHFWESRFKSQALLDETALITAMAYVDLNPVRATLASSIEQSDFTSAQDRWRDVASQPHTLDTHQRPQLLPFAEVKRQSDADYLPFPLKDYLDLVDSTGRAVVSGKRGSIDAGTLTLIQSLPINPERWFDTVTQLQRHYERAVGAPERLRRLANRWNQQWLRGTGQARRLYLSSG
jgi:putative transposase